MDGLAAERDGLLSRLVECDSRLGQPVGGKEIILFGFTSSLNEFIVYAGVRVWFSFCVYEGVSLTE